jgi:hypothetical protein
MVYVAAMDFTGRTSQGGQQIKKGQVLSMQREKAQPLLSAGKIAELQPCPICGGGDYWLSIHGPLVCTRCHPPARPELVKTRIVKREGRAFVLLDSDRGEQANSDQTCTAAGGE